MTQFLRQLRRHYLSVTTKSELEKNKMPKKKYKQNCWNKFGYRRIFSWIFLYLPISSFYQKIQNANICKSQQRTSAYISKVFQPLEARFFKKGVLLKFCIFITMKDFSRIPFLKKGDSSNQSEEIMKLKVLHSLQVMHYAVRDNRKLVWKTKSRHVQNELVSWHRTKILV